MIFRRFARLPLGAALATALCWSASVRADAPTDKLNYLFILADDLGWTDLGVYGSSFYETPALDTLAKSSARFTQAYTACPVCSPTRASILTGKYPARMATTDWFGAPQPETVDSHKLTRTKPLLPAPYVEHLPLEEFTLAEALKEAGYATFFAGKWHLGGEGYLPEDQGFDINKGGHHRGGPPGGYFSPYKNPKLEDGPEGEHLPDRLATETIDFIKAHRDQRFLAYLSLYSVHTPLQSRPDLKAKYEAKAAALPDPGPIWGVEGDREVRLVQNHAVYAGMVEAMDQAVGRVLESLKRLDLERNTVVVFLSDNGGLSTSEGHPTSNLPLRAGKGWLYEGGIRTPLLVRWPGTTDGGPVINTPVTTTDFYPTLLAMSGLPPRPEQHLDGADLTPLLKGQGAPERDTLYWHYPHYGNQGGTPGAAIRQGDWKLIEFFEDRPPELYNLATDPGEQRDLAGDHPEKAVELRAKLDAWQAETGARFPSPNPNATPR
ncbi:MAG: sulfatase [Candidatus Hydrogenedentes bacterium]|nr:sulfatase [Candidatus Hydrogenedentota bacterium]